jgi:RimJ/RimL family protein N-acetyltransferase
MLAELQLETPRLLLRVPQVSELDSWSAFMADAEAAHFIGGAIPRAMTWRVIMTMIGAWHSQGFAMFSVYEKATGLWVGRVGPWMPEGWPGTEVGWGIVRQAWGRGYATEAAITSTNWSFDNLGWKQVIHTISPENLASQGVARKLGAHNWGPGRLPPPLHEIAVDVWGQSREQWCARFGDGTR